MVSGRNEVIGDSGVGNGAMGDGESLNQELGIRQSGIRRMSSRGNTTCSGVAIWDGGKKERWVGNPPYGCQYIPGIKPDCDHHC